VILAKTIVKSPEENGPVLQFYKRYEIKERPNWVFFPRWLAVSNLKMIYEDH